MANCPTSLSWIEFCNIAGMMNTHTCNQRNRKHSGAVSPFYNMLNELFNQGIKMMQEDKGSCGESKMTNTPRMNVTSDDNTIKIELLIPGVEKKEDIKLSYDDKMLTVKYDAQTESEENSDNYNYQEFGNKSYLRTIRVRPNMNMQDMTAKYANGVLTLDIPLKEENKEVNEVSVS